MDRSISFEHIADRYDETRGGEARGRHFAAELLARLPDGRVLEVGIGTGSIALPLHEAGREVVGVDIARSMLAHALARLGPVVAEADAQQLPIASSSVSAVAAVWVLHVVADPAAVIEEVARVLAPGGRFCVISAQGHHAAGDEIDAALDAISPGPVHHDDAGSLTRAAASVGLALVEQTVTATQTYQRSPAVEARRMEKRLASHTFAMDDRTFAREVQPKIDALRALPDPDRDRTRVVHHDLLVFDRP